MVIDVLFFKLACNLHIGLTFIRPVILKWVAMRDKLSFVYFQIYNLIRKYLLKLLVLILLTNVIPFIQEFCGGVQTMFLEHFDPSPVVGELLWFENRFLLRRQCNRNSSLLVIVL
jgi:hypothetical protein